MSFHVGQRVVCVDDSPIKDGRSSLVRRGVIYTIAELPFSIHGPCVRLIEVEPYPEATGWHARRFRPVVERKTDISAFTGMLIAAPKEMERIDG